MDWPVPIPDDKPEEQKTPLEPTKVNTELSDPKSTPAEVHKKSTPSKGRVFASTIANPNEILYCNNH